MKKLAFTLAEIMIVLAVVGVLAAVLLPAAKNIMPDENLMKFKRAHKALTSTIRELVTSDKYYLDGDLGVRPNGDLLDGTHTGDYAYLCQTMADILNPEIVNCVNSSRTADPSGGFVSKDWYGSSSNAYYYDRYCRMHQTSKRNTILKGEGIELSDGAVIYETRVDYAFGIPSTMRGTRFFVDDYLVLDTNNLNQRYKIICVDIDGVSNDFSFVDYSENQSYDETTACDGMCPFGYGLRYDGKIELGILAQKYLAKSIQEKD